MSANDKSNASGFFIDQHLSELEKILARNTRSQADEFAQGLRLVDAIWEELGIEHALEAEQEER